MEDWEAGYQRFSEQQAAEKHALLVASDYDKEHLRTVVNRGWKAVRKLARAVVPESHLHDWQDGYGIPFLQNVIDECSNVRLVKIVFCPMFYGGKLLRYWVETLTPEQTKFTRELCKAFDSVQKGGAECQRFCRNVCGYASGTVEETVFVQETVGRSLKEVESKIPQALVESYEDFMAERSIFYDSDLPRQPEPRELRDKLGRACEGDDERKQVFYEIVADGVAEGLSRLDAVEKHARTGEGLDYFSIELLQDALQQYLNAGALIPCERDTPNGNVWDVVMIPAPCVWDTIGDKTFRRYGNNDAMAYGLLAPAAFNLFRELPPWKGQLVIRRETEIDPSLCFPAWYYEKHFKLKGATLRQVACDPIYGIRRSQLNRRDKGYYYPDVHRRYPGSVPKCPPDFLSTDA